MRFREVFRFELAYQVRRPGPWLIGAALLVLDFLMTRDGSLSEVLDQMGAMGTPDKH